MSKEELELRKRKAKAKAKALRMRQEAQAYVDATAQENKDTATGFLEGMGEAVATMGVAAAESVPGAKQIGSLINAGADMVLAEDRNESFSEAYQRNLGSVNETIDEYKEKYPIGFYGTDIAIQAGLATATGGASIAGDLAVAGASAASRYRGNSVTEQLEQTIGGTALAAGLAGLARAGSSAVGRLSQKLARFSEETTLSALNPTLNKRVLRQTNNIVKHRYKGDYELAAQHADEIMGLQGGNLVTGPKSVAQNAENMRIQIGEEIEETIAYIDEANFVLKGDKKAINGGVLQAELKHAVGKNSRFRQDLPPALREDFSEIDELIDELTLTVPKRKGPEKILERSDSPNHAGGVYTKYIEKDLPPSDEIVARELGVKDVFNIKVKIAQKVEDVFAKKLNGAAMTPSKLASMKAQQAKIVGKLSDVIDRQAQFVAGETGDDVARELVTLNKKYAMANHLAGLANDTVSTTSNSAPQLFKDLTSFKGLFVAGALGIGTGSPAASAGIMLAQAVAKNPRTPFKVAQGVSKLSNFMQKFPNEKVSQRAMVAIQNATNPDDLQKEIGSFVSEIDLIESAQAGEPIRRNSEHVIGLRNTIGSTIRGHLGDEAANQFHEAIENEDMSTVGQMMDQLSKTPVGRRVIEQGVGWDGMVFDPADKAQLEEEVRRAELPVSEEIRLLEELKQNKVPNIQPVEPYQRSWTPRDKSKPQY